MGASQHTVLLAKKVTCYRIRRDEIHAASTRRQIFVVFLLAIVPVTYTFQPRTMWHSGPFQLPSQVVQKPSKSLGKQLSISFQRRDENQKSSRLFGSLRPKGSGEIIKKRSATEASSLTSYSGILVLLTVPLAWGTYVPVVRFLYQIEPPVPGLVFSACYYAVASITMLFLVQLNDSARVKDEKVPTKSSTPPFPIQGGIELGSYLFVANCLQVIGLETVPSDRAGFLVQLTTVMVPILEAIFAGNIFAVPTKTWGGCVLALLGISIMGLDTKLELSPSVLGDDGDRFSSLLSPAFSSFTQGDLLILAAALLYALHVVRLSRYAKQSTPMRLAAAKASTEAILSIALVGGLSTAAGFTASIGTMNTALSTFVVKTSTDIAHFMSSFTLSVASGTIPQSALLSALGAVLWTGWVTCAYTIYAQSFGQSRVRCVSIPSSIQNVSLCFWEKPIPKYLLTIRFPLFI